MRIKLYVARIVLVGVSMCVTFGFGQVASASSIYDDVVKVVDSVRVPSSAGLTDITASYPMSMASVCGQEFLDSFHAAVGGGGDWAVMNMDSGNGLGVTMVWSPVSGGVTARFGQDSPSLRYLYLTGSLGYAHFTWNVTQSRLMCQYATLPKNLSYIVLSQTTFPADQGVYINTFDVDYPSGYEGEDAMTLGSSLDGDGDGVSGVKEVLQGTSDSTEDTDGDGLDDYVESQWYPSRNSLFCGASECAYPDPLKKDVYVEIDWMDDGINEYKPSTTQLNLVKNMFNAKNINLHIDTGQYGGGNELSNYTQALKRVSTTGQVDFWDYKDGGDGQTANFATNRKNIWRYMIYGNDYDGSNGSSGWARVMGDDIFISGGVIDSMTGLTSTDRAIADTIAHEIGHSLCLSNQKIYQEQPVECVYSGIDNSDSSSAHYNLSDYESVMNYRYQLTDIDDLGIVNYSDGSRVLNDHNDWSAVLTGMNGFSGTKTALGAKQLDERYTVMPDGGVIVDEAPIAEIRRAYQEKQALYQKQNVGQLDSGALGGDFTGTNKVSLVSAIVPKEDDSSNSGSQDLLPLIG